MEMVPLTTSAPKLFFKLYICFDQKKAMIIKKLASILCGIQSHTK